MEHSPRQQGAHSSQVHTEPPPGHTRRWAVKPASVVLLGICVRETKTDAQTKACMGTSMKLETAQTFFNRWMVTPYFYHNHWKYFYYGTPENLTSQRELQLPLCWTSHQHPTGTHISHKQQFPYLSPPSINSHRKAACPREAGRHFLAEGLGRAVWFGKLPRRLWLSPFFREAP